MVALYFLLAAIPFYLIGAIPTGYLLAKKHGIDLTKQGSGNVGATNVSRVLGKKSGILTLLIDAAKGGISVMLAGLLSGSAEFSAFAGFSAVCGHCFSIPNYMKGGKGVATALGVIFAISVKIAFVAVAVFVALFSVFRIVSLGSIGAALVTPIAAALFSIEDAYQAALAAIALLIVFRHKTNLIRLTRGEEPRYSLTTSKASGPI